jgi:hypothetical protein
VGRSGQPLGIGRARDRQLGVEHRLDVEDQEGMWQGASILSRRFPVNAWVARLSGLAETRPASPRSVRAQNCATAQGSANKAHKFR